MTCFSRTRVLIRGLDTHGIVCVGVCTGWCAMKYEKLRISKMLILIMEFVMFKNTWMTLLLKYVPVCNALIGNCYFKLDFELTFIANHLKWNSYWCLRCSSFFSLFLLFDLTMRSDFLLYFFLHNGSCERLLWLKYFVEFTIITNSMRPEHKSWCFLVSILVCFIIL